jgi:DNA-binding XRE family transcriptional regulator
VTTETRDTVTIPRAEFDRLCQAAQELEDLRAGLDAQLSLARGDEEKLPREVAARLIAGDENPVRVWREYRGLSLRRLAEKANISPAYLSDIERAPRRQRGSLDAYFKICEALGVDLDDLA